MLLVNYANHVFRDSQLRNSRTGREVGGFDRVLSYGPRDIDRTFRATNSAILSIERGNGAWLWKPYFIHRTLEQLKDGEFLFYCDAGAHFVRSIAPLVEISRREGQDLLVFELDRDEHPWTKRDAFVLLGCDEPCYANTRQRLGGFSLWRRSAFARDFAREWLHHAQDARILTDAPNVCGLPDYPEFREHRWDQSILSLLSKKRGIPAYRDPSQWGNSDRDRHPASTYDQLVELTRQRSAPPPPTVLDKALGRSKGMLAGIARRLAPSSKSSRGA